MAQCVNSWKAHGFIPYSINSYEENISEILAELEIKSILVNRSAKDLYSRPLVYLNDFLRLASSVTSGPLVITNSDILLDINETDLDKIRNIKINQGIVEHRKDIIGINDRFGDFCESGFDFFVFHSDDIANVNCKNLAFGMPWWDHFLPIVLSGMGMKFSKLTNSSVFHLIHSERWDRSDWIKIGQEFLNEIEANFPESNYDYISLASKYLNRAAFKNKYNLFEKLPWLIDFISSKRRDPHQLRALSKFNLTWIDSCFKDF